MQVYPAGLGGRRVGVCSEYSWGWGRGGHDVLYLSVQKQVCLLQVLHLNLVLSVFQDIEMVIFLSHLWLRLPAGPWGAGGARSAARAWAAR